MVPRHLLVLLKCKYGLGALSCGETCPGRESCVTVGNARMRQNVNATYELSMHKFWHAKIIFDQLFLENIF